MSVYMIWGNESNNDYIAPIIKIEEPRASELTIWEASGLAAGAPTEELPRGEHSQGGGVPPLVPSGDHPGSGCSQETS